MEVSTDYHFDKSVKKQKLGNLSSISFLWKEACEHRLLLLLPLLLLRVNRELKHQAILRRRRRPEVNFCSGRRSGVVCQVVFVSRERESLHFGVVSRT